MPLFSAIWSFFFDSSKINHWTSSLQVTLFLLRRSEFSFLNFFGHHVGYHYPEDQPYLRRSFIPLAIIPTPTGWTCLISLISSLAISSPHPSAGNASHESVHLNPDHWTGLSTLSLTSMLGEHFEWIPSTFTGGIRMSKISSSTSWAFSFRPLTFFLAHARHAPYRLPTNLPQRAALHTLPTISYFQWT